LARAPGIDLALRQGRQPRAVHREHGDPYAGLEGSRACGRAAAKMGGRTRTLQAGPREHHLVLAVGVAVPVLAARAAAEPRLGARNDPTLAREERVPRSDRAQLLADAIHARSHRGREPRALRLLLHRQALADVERRTSAGRLRATRLTSIG